MKSFWANVERFKHAFSRQSEIFLSLKNKYENKKCFIVATGPSLTLEDLDLIKGQYSFSVNSSINAFDNTTWRPTFYVLTDTLAYAKFSDRVDGIEEIEKVFYPVWMDSRKSDKYIHFINDRYQILHAQAINRYRGTIYPSKKPEKYIEDAPSVIFSSIQIAIFMGFKEIYLLGQDCNYKCSQQHSKIADLGFTCVADYSTGDRMIDVFYNYAEAIKDTDVKIFNCTRGGLLEAFERVPLEEAIKR